jgi:hypothetical protein
MVGRGESITRACSDRGKLDVNPIGCDKDLDCKIKTGLITREYAERINLERLEMTVKIEGSALSIPESLDSLKVTPLVMHRIWFRLHTVKEWYAIMKEARAMFGKNWRTQSRVKRRLEHTTLWGISLQPVPVWFEVPDETFATWVAVKHAVIAMPPPGK